MPDARWWDWHDRCRIDRVVDGDTVLATFWTDLGFYGKAEITAMVRLAGLDAPELRAADPVLRTRARASKAALEAMLPPGTVCSARTARDGDRYGRWLAVLTLADGTDVNAALLVEGHARPYEGGSRG